MVTEPDNYIKTFNEWDILDRLEKQKIIAKYIDNIVSEKDNNKINIISSEFRSSYLKDLQVNHNEYGMPYNIPLFKDDLGCFLNMNHDIKTEEEVKKYFDKLCSTLTDYKFNYYEVDVDDEVDVTNYKTNSKLEKIIRLVILKQDKRYKKNTTKQGVISIDLTKSKTSLPIETYKDIFEKLRELAKKEVELEKS